MFLRMQQFKHILFLKVGEISIKALQKNFMLYSPFMSLFLHYYCHNSGVLRDREHDPYLLLGEDSSIFTLW